MDQNPHNFTMSGQIAPKFLTTEEAALFMRVSISFLSQHRYKGTGPNYRKFGGRVVYSLDDLIDWAEQQKRSNTSEPFYANLCERQLAE